MMTVEQKAETQDTETESYTHSHGTRWALHTCLLYALNHLDRNSQECKYQAWLGTEFCPSYCCSSVHILVGNSHGVQDVVGRIPLQ